MVCAHVAADAALDANCQGNLQLSTRHVMQLGGVVDELVHRQSNEVDEHDFHHRPESGSCRANSESHDRSFADGCVDHTVLAESFGKSGGDTERPAQSDVFTKEIDRWVAAHLFV